MIDYLKLFLYNQANSEEGKYYSKLYEQKKEIMEYAKSLGFVVFLDKSDKYANSASATACFMPKGPEYITFVKKDPKNPEVEICATWYPGQGKYLHYHDPSDRFKR